MSEDPLLRMPGMQPEQAIGLEQSDGCLNGHASLGKQSREDDRPFDAAAEERLCALARSPGADREILYRPDLERSARGGDG
ncbi:MAG: hypothetical protein KGY48_03895 [Wenzhouxiangellaceae bacterium]|nr:hypothetical protein [Wenzhouxiangellaceae bacterium]MBS3747825.1 hypothetical protein [Wenzhouxiangellaceae bacterium]